MAARKKRKKSCSARLTARMSLFVEHYVISYNPRDAALKAGYSPKTAASIGRNLLTRPIIKEAIAKARHEQVERLHIDQDMVLMELVSILKTSIGDYLTFGPNGVILKKMEEIEPAKVAQIKEISQGKNGIKVALPDKLDALEKLAKHLGMYEKSRQANKNPENIAKELLLKFRNKEITAQEAAIDFDLAGIPIPESLRAALSHMEPETQSADNGDYAVISPEEMAEKAKQRQAEIENQMGFVEGRKSEVEDLKTEMGGGSYAMQKLDEEDKDL